MLKQIYPNDLLPGEYTELKGMMAGSSANNSTNLINIIRAVIAIETKESLQREMRLAAQYEELQEEFKRQQDKRCEPAQ